MAVLVTLATAAITKSLPRLIGQPDHPRRRYLLLNLAYSAAFAASGGYVTAIVAKADPLRNILMLAIVILLLSALSALQLRGKQPVTYQLALIVLTPIAALAGGLSACTQPDIASSNFKTPGGYQRTQTSPE